jgi:hypothetical protein
MACPLLAVAGRKCVTPILTIRKDPMSRGSDEDGGFRRDLPSFLRTTNGRCVAVGQVVKLREQIFTAQT